MATDKKESGAETAGSSRLNSLVSDWPWRWHLFKGWVEQQAFTGALHFWIMVLTFAVTIGWCVWFLKGSR